MQPIVEAKYLAIEWFDKNTVSKITESIHSIDIEVQDDHTHIMEIQAYIRIEKGFDGQVGFQMIDSTNETQPYFMKADGKKANLLKIINPDTKKEWWIEDGEWSKKHECRLSELWNHAGEATVYFGRIACHIGIRAISFTKEQLHLYLEDFKNDFWYLILKKNSLTQAEVKNSNEQIKILNEETIELIKNFIKHTQSILKNPKIELKESQRLKDIKQVKPVAKTFMEIATGGMKRKLTSRDAVESYNVAENRYIHYALYQVSKIVLNMTKATQYINNFYQNKAESEQKRVDKFTDKKIIDKEVVENTINNLKEKINKINIALENIENTQESRIKEQCEQEQNKSTLQDHINKAIQKQTLHHNNMDQVQKFYIKLERRQDNYQNKLQFWGKIKYPNEKNWHGIENKDIFSLEFNLDSFGFLQENQEFLISAITNYTNRQTNDRNIHKFHFQYISEFKPLNLEEPKRTIKYETLYIKLDKKQDKFQDKIQFWGQESLENIQNWQQFKKEDSLSLEFDFNIFNNILQEYTEYKITAYIEKSEITKRNSGKIHKRYFKYITKIEQMPNSSLDKELNHYLEQKSKLETTNWIRPLNNKEKHEQQKEKEAIESQIKLLNEESKIGNKLIKQLEPLSQALKKLLIQFNKLFIAKDNYFPNSMTFVQNPHYQGGYKYYDEIKKIVGIDESLFLLIPKVEKIGVLDIPTLYERWCFLQIIKVLMGQYHFIPEENWKTKLIIQMVGNTDEVRKNIRNISIKFENPLLERKIILHYEKELNGHNSKRPDYLLEIESLKTNQKQTLIMDAKFKENVNVKDLIDELYHKKNYSQNNKNTVFILHPDTKNSIAKKLNPSGWGNDAYYGEAKMFDFQWDNNEFPNHKYGSILLSPIRDSIDYGNYLDNLQRLIGMNMQYQLENNSKDDITIVDLEEKQNFIDPMPREKVFCLKCSSDMIKEIDSGWARSKKGKYYQMECEECKHHFIYFYCWNCGYRLIKNGSYWSYHAFQPLEPLDIQCPHCAKFWHQNVGYDESKVKQISNQKDTAIQNINKNEVELTNELVFNNYEDGFKYIKENPGRILTRNPNGSGWIIKT